MNPQNEERLQLYLPLGSLIILAVVTTTCFLFFSNATAVSSLVGGIIAVVNMLWQRRSLGALLKLTPHDRPMFSAFVRFILRMSLSAVALYLIIVSPWFSLWGLLAGLSVTVLCLFGLTLYVVIPSKER